MKSVLDAGPFLFLMAQKKADVANHTEVVDHVGLLVNGPPDVLRAALQVVFRYIRFKPRVSPLQCIRANPTIVYYTPRRRESNRAPVARM